MNRSALGAESDEEGAFSGCMDGTAWFGQAVFTGSGAYAGAATILYVDLAAIHAHTGAGAPASNCVIESGIYTGSGTGNLVAGGTSSFGRVPSGPTYCTNRRIRQRRLTRLRFVGMRAILDARGKPPTRSFVLLTLISLRITTATATYGWGARKRHGL